MQPRGPAAFSFATVCSLAADARIGQIGVSDSIPISAETATLQRYALTLAIAACGAPALANDSRVEKMLKQLDPDARFEQICDLEAMKRIGKEAKPHKPERTIVSALSQPKVAASTMSGTGGAFKSKGQWIQFSFMCQTSPDHMKVQAFTYQIGEPIPEEKWEPHGLW
jgi:hypothetical protein